MLWIVVANHKADLSIPDSGEVVGKSSKVLHQVLCVGRLHCDLVVHDVSVEMT